MYLGHMQQGRFTSNGQDKILKLRADIDWLKVINWTGSNAGGAASTEFYWQRGMADGAGIRYFKDAGTNLNVENLADPNGFTLVSNIDQKFSAAKNITGNGITDDTPPVVNSNAHGFRNGDIVRIYNADGAEQLGGIDFEIGNRAPNSFELIYMRQIADAPTATSGTVKKLYYDPYFYPRRRYITKMRPANAINPANPSNQTIITLSVSHGYTIGQEVRLLLPDIFGVSQANNVKATIVNTGQADANGATNTITIDLDSNGLGTFRFPTTTETPFTPAQVVPIGQDTGESLSQNVNILGGATDNQGYIGINLAGGANSPAGGNNNIMYWIAGKSFSVDNQ